MVDLFCGCGGLTLGVAQAAHDSGRGMNVVLAVDNDPAPLNVYRQNFPQARVRRAAIEALFDGPPGGRPTNVEELLAADVGPVDILVGGPPCQGHSDLNNWTRRTDPKNELYLKMARAAEILRPAVVLIENVPTVAKSGANVVARTQEVLGEAEFESEASVISLLGLGVAQSRRRHVLLATSLGQPRRAAKILGATVESYCSPVDLRAAIGDLMHADPGVPFDCPPRATPQNLARMTWLLENDAVDLPNRLRPPCHQGEHSYKSMYGRLEWNKPAQTVTSGFGSIGQGRYMHPELPRALTPHEAARIQGFPDYFDFTSEVRRTALAQMIGNAVPPPLAKAVFANYLAQ
ncbi:MAG: DNA cytosine methyltransferase [Dehalococcoidia bacterium]|nr:DNA cytosine methyltransferase [Dehalococcoidia bacterium]